MVGTFQGALGGFTREVDLILQSSLAALAHVDQLRNGRPLELTLAARGEICRLIPVTNPLQPNGSKPYVQGEPSDFAGSARITVPVDDWTAILRTVGLSANVLIEIPLPASRPSPWDGVWKAVDDARKCLEAGGTTGWQGSVTAARHALQLWQGVEAEKHGAGWKSPTPTERESRTSQERIDNLRWHLLQVAHEGPHSLSEEWSRDEAVLVLATLAALLGVRKP